MTMRFLLVFAGTTLLASGARAQRADSAAFIVRLGTDTVSVERYVRTGNRIVMDGVQRSPSTTLHRLELELAPGGDVGNGRYTMLRPAGDTIATRTFALDRDSATVTTLAGGRTRTARVPIRRAIPLAGPFYAPYELAMMRAVAGRAARDSVQLLPGEGTVQIPVERIGADSLALTNQCAEPMRAHVDREGRLLHLHTPAFTTVERLRWVDLEAMARDFAARDAAGRAMGPLSPRQAYRVGVGGANLWVDYGRPAMRGRPVWGALVPYGQIWRMGANDAAHLSTDRTIQLGGLTLAPGTYTLFLLPTESDWTLVVNRQTGISGLEYDAANDLGRVPLTRETAERPAEQFTLELRPAQDGTATLVIAWDRARASVPIRIVE